MAKIGVFDSGVGGLSVFREIYKAFPGEDYIYFSDNAYCPYGEKSPEFIRERACSIASDMIAEGVQVIVVACNTATSAAIATLRERFSIPFIGMEPALKPAANGTRTGVVGVLATKGTLSGAKYHGIKEQFGADVKVVESIGDGFVELVESGETSGPRAEAVIERSLTPILDAGADVVVLGCTHYPFLLPTLCKLAGPEVRFIDPAPAIARRLGDVMAESGIPLRGEGGIREFRASGNPETLNRMKW